MYTGACLLKPEMLEHWLEEGRAAVVRRGSEIHRGKRKAEVEHANGFLPVFLREPPPSVSTHDDNEVAPIFEQNDEDDDEIITANYLDDNVEEECLVDDDEDMSEDEL